MELVSVHKKLEEYGIEIGGLSVCDMSTHEFSFMRAQMSAQFEYSVEKGPRVTEEFFDEKCLNVCKLANEKRSQLLMFPEYAISYAVLLRIASEPQYQPKKGALWCLPCQGISFNKIMEEIGRMEQAGVIVIKDGIEEDKGLECEKDFVNALFYCFWGKKAGERKLIFLPQMKLCHMRDEDHICEAGGLTLGRWIYYFGNIGRSNILMSIICADVFHTELNWGFIQENLGDKLIILHPQLNTNPKQADFRGLRQNMMSYNNRSLYITCNWAKGTRLAGQGGNLEIGFSWSCIYFKHSGESSFETWINNNRRVFDENDKVSLHGSYMRNKRTEIWYAGNEEMLQYMMIAKPASNSVGVLIGPCVVAGKARYQYEGGHWQNSILCFSFKEIVSAIGWDYMEAIEEIEGEKAYAFPILCASGYETAGFFDLLTAKEDHYSYRMNENEEMECAVSVLNSMQRDVVQKNVSEYVTLVDVLKKGELPDHLKHRFGPNAKLVYRSDRSVVYNYMDGQKDTRVLLARAENKRAAEKFVDYMSKRLIGYREDEETELPLRICVFYKRINSRKEDFLPKESVKITDPDRMESISSISRGGTE